MLICTTTGCLARRVLSRRVHTSPLIPVLVPINTFSIPIPIAIYHPIPDTVQGSSYVTQLHLSPSSRRASEVVTGKHGTTQAVRRPG